MDFTLTEEQQAVAVAAEGLLAGLAGADRVAEVEASEDRVDRSLWSALASADLLGVAVPSELGGAGLGLTELCLLLEAQGRHVAPVPLWPTLVMGALPIARFGSDQLQRRWLPEVTAGRCFLSAALASNAGRGVPVVSASAAGSGWLLDGTAPAVPQAHLAARVLVPASTEGGGIVLGLIDPHAEAARLEPAVTTNRELHPHLHLDRYQVGKEDLLAGPGEGEAALDWLLQVAATGLCALQVGVAEAALRRTAEYLNQRVQFERPLSTFQATKLRAADAAIDIEAMRVTLWQAAWRLDTGRPAAAAVAVAKWQASERGQRVVHATQHLHGGVGADIGYPIHRYFLWGKQIELLLGGPTAQLARLGRLIADDALVAGAGTGSAGERAGS
jgi:alkylation response protein AidB-like acyl-CoA dehydrogenase